jgi:hypothetical protein
MASVIHRTTYQYLESVNSPDYPTGTWLHNPDTSGLSEVPREFWIVDGETVREMTAAEKDANCLANCKIAKCAAIDARSDELIVAGFVHSSKTFSLSDAAQNRIMAVHQVRDDASLDYPIVWNTIDDLDTLSLADSAAVHAFYLAALDTYRGHVDGGTSLKDQVRAASTHAAVQAITDSR